MSGRVSRVLVAIACFLVVFVASAAQATPGDRFTASISPAAVQPLTSVAYALAIGNLASSSHAADNAHVAVPAGFQVDGTSLSATTSAHGSCSAATWTVALSPDATTIDAAAPDPAGDLCPGATLTLTFNASSPSTEATYQWTTTLLRGTSSFALQGAQPVVTVDGTPPPQPDLTSAPPDPSDSPSATFAFADGDETATFLCQLDGGAFAACTSPTTYTGLGEGVHSFAVEAVDPAGNVSTATAYTWTIDLTPPPAPTLTSEPPSFTTDTSATFSFVDDDATAGFRCELDGGAFSSCTSPISYVGLGEGIHTFAVKAVDPAGNESTTTSFTWTIDLTPPPQPTLTSEPPSASASTSATFGFVDDDPTATFACELDGSPFVSCTSPTVYTGLGEGPHTFGVKAIDPAGNQSTTRFYSWIVDLTPPPTPTITAMPPSVTASTSATFAFVDGDATATFICQLDGGAFAPCTSPITYGELAEGGHSFAVKAVDPAGNQSAAASYSWTIDLTPPPPPTITGAPPNVTDSTSATFSFVDGDPTAGFRCRLDDAEFAPCTSPITYTGLAEGVHTFTVQAVDPAGNQSDSTSYTWTIDLTNPVVTIDPASEPPDPTNQTSANFVFTSNQAGSTFECRLDTDQFSPCSSPQGYSGLTDGRHSFGVRATDPAGNEGLPTIYQWTVDTVPPTTTITDEPPAVSSSDSASFRFTSSETPSTFACSLDGSVFSTCTTPQVYTGLGDGQHTFEVRATDLAGNTDPTPAAYSWRVATQLPPDRTPPGTVEGLSRRVGYGSLRLAWSLPTDADFDHVDVLRSRNAKGAARSVVYHGNGTTYTDKRFQNGTYYRYEVVAYDTSGNGSAAAALVESQASHLLQRPGLSRRAESPQRLALDAALQDALEVGLQRSQLPFAKSGLSLVGLASVRPPLEGGVRATPRHRHLRRPVGRTRTNA